MSKLKILSLLLVLSGCASTQAADGTQTGPSIGRQIMGHVFAGLAGAGAGLANASKNNKTCTGRVIGNVEYLDCN